MSKKREAVHSWIDEAGAPLCLVRRVPVGAFAGGGGDRGAGGASAVLVVAASAAAPPDWQNVADGRSARCAGSFSRKAPAAVDFLSS